MSEIQAAYAVLGGLGLAMFLAGVLAVLGVARGIWPPEPGTAHKIDNWLKSAFRLRRAGRDESREAKPQS